MLCLGFAFRIVRLVPGIADSRKHIATQQSLWRQLEEYKVAEFGA